MSNPKRSNNSNATMTVYNMAVKLSYFAILKAVKQLLSTIEREELRFTLEREDKIEPVIGTIIHEIISPLLYLRLEYHPANVFAIHYGFEQVLAVNQYSKITSAFIRSIYKYTSKDATAINIEEAVRTDWCINTCSEMYEYTEERSKHHIFKLIKHKVTATQRKQLLSVA